ncbi:MAG: hypothetical protein WCP36_05115 [Methanomicrobiales archaeon]
MTVISSRYLSIMAKKNGIPPARKAGAIRREMKEVGPGDVIRFATSQIHHV